MPRLPEFVAPMLARSAPPFDSEQHLFEIKWDGTRAIALVDGDDGALRLHNRNRFDLTARFPELDCLRALPPGTALDGEVVLLVDGKPDFEAVMARDKVRDAAHARRLAARHPVTYAVFDQLWDGFRDLRDEPLATRRAHLQRTLEAAGARLGSFVVFSDGVVGAGRAFFEQAAQQGLEGVVAKRLDSRYLSGQRSDAWLKVKRRESLHCVILGYVLDGNRLTSLVVATDDGGTLKSVGRVGSGLTDAMCTTLLERLRALRRDTPLVPCDEREAQWVEPSLFCLVRYVERTGAGNLRAPVFVRLVDGDEA